MNKELIHRVIERVCEEQGSAIALEQGDEHISYAVLNRRSNQLAHLFVSLGIAKEQVIGVALTSGFRSVSSLLGCLKCGGVYLPLDLGFSAKRLIQMLGDTSPGVLVLGSEQQTAAESVLSSLGLVVPYLVLLPAGSSVLFSGLDVSLGGLLDSSELRVLAYHDGGYHPFTAYPAVLSEENLETDPAADGGSYIFYTSGSTGSGKAILGCQRSLSHYIHWHMGEWSVGSSFRVSQLAPLTFDASLKDILVSLAGGGTLCIPLSSTRDNMELLALWLRDSRVTMLQCVPSVLRLLLPSLKGLGTVPALPCMDYVLLAGERLYGRDVLNWRAVNGTCGKLSNLYGLSETTILKSCYHIPDQQWQGGEVIPVGRAISNTSIAVITGKQLSGRETVGEIYIKSPFMSKGYLDGSLNGSVFVQNPLVIDREDIVCRTGDLGRYRSDGNLEVLGRRDDQVKLHGVRIELNEVRAAILGLSGIDQVELLLHQQEDYHQELVCYYTGELREVELLRTALIPLLNSYMIPSYFEWLASFPLNVNGKVDRKALPTPQALAVRSGYEPPVGEVEEKLSVLWQQVLGRKDIGRRYSFFNIGGSSLKAVQLIARVYKELGVQLQIGEVFANPTLAGQAELVGRSIHQTYQVIPKVAEQLDYALSHAQKRLWVLDQLDPEMVAYSRPIAFNLYGKIDISALEAAFSSLVERHESLRTIFVVSDGVPRQRVLDAASSGFRLEFIDLQLEKYPVHSAQLVSKKEASTPFDLSAGPLLRVKLLQTSAGEYYFLFTIHHIISDEWSIQIMISELLSLYNAYSQGEKNPLLPLRIQYRDYAQWEQEQLSGHRMEAHQAYWLEQLSGDLPVLELPTDRLRPAVQSYRGARNGQHLNVDLSKGLRELGQQQGATLFMVLLAGLNTLLYRYSGQKDLVIGSPIAGREHADLDEQIGFFINTLVLRTHLSETQSFTNLLDQVKQTCLAAYEHQSYPFNKLVEDLNPVRDFSRSPLFNLMFAVDDKKSGEGEPIINQIEISPSDIEVSTSLFDITFRFTEQDDSAGLYLSLEYNTDLFDENHIERIGRHFVQLLKAIVSDPGLSLQEFDYLGALEREELLFSFNDTALKFPEDQTLVSLFEERVAAHPDAVALVCGDLELTYNALNQQSNRLAHYLKNHYNIKCDQPIGLLVGRNQWLLIGILGILKAGGAYLPIDPIYPLERIDYMLNDANIKILLTESVFDFVNINYRETLIVMDHLDLLDYSKNNPIMMNKSSDLAYVIFTSGSSGKPKGVMIEHKAVVNYLLWAKSYYFSDKSNCNFGLFTSYSFDLSVTGLFSSLISGGTLFLWNGNDNSQLLIQAFGCSDVNTLKLTPSHLNLIPHLPELTNNSVECIILGGEVLGLNQVADLKKINDKVLIFNEYGPTETTVGCTATRIESGEVITLGKPIANVQIYVLDELHNLQGIGVVGEICVGGAGLARGYLNDEKLTVRKFITNPYGQGRLYCTGDLGKWLDDGNLEYLGRKDEQVKLRGYRIELAEIEGVINRNDSVCQSVVVLAGEAEDSYLVAYISIVSGHNASDEQLRSYLRLHLPEYMVPSLFVYLDSLPITAGGKVDKRALPNPLRESRLHRPPSKPLEQKLAQIWEQVLNRKGISLEDNFFESGGHSIKAIQLIARIHKEMNVKLELTTLFAHQTLAKLCAHIEFLDWIIKGQENYEMPNQLTKEIKIDETII